MRDSDSIRSFYRPHNSWALRFIEAPSSHRCWKKTHKTSHPIPSCSKQQKVCPRDSRPPSWQPVRASDGFANVARCSTTWSTGKRSHKPVGASSSLRQTRLTTRPSQGLPVTVMQSPCTRPASSSSWTHFLTLKIPDCRAYTRVKSLS